MAVYYFVSLEVADRKIEREISELVAIGAIGSESELVDEVERRATVPGNSTLYALARKGGRFVPYYWLGGNVGGPMGGKANEWPVIRSSGSDGLIDFRSTRLQDNGRPKVIEAHGRYVVFNGPAIEEGENGREYHLLVGRDVESAWSLSRRLAFGIVAFGFASMFTGAWTGYRISRRFVQRTEEIRETADSIRGGDLNQRIALSGRDDEFDRLATTLNSMLDQIKKLLDGMKEVSDNIAHDLRTPLNRLKHRLEIARNDMDRSMERHDGCRDAVDHALRESEGLLSTFNALLRIARLEAGAVADEMTVLDPAPLVQDIVELYEPFAEEEGLNLHYELEAGLQLKANRELLSQALANLIENSIKYSPANTSVFVTLQRKPSPAEGQSSRVCLTVRDEGPGIPMEDRERVLKRFVRLDRGRGEQGSGLGLSLVSAITQLHNGNLHLYDSPDGEGLVVCLDLPGTV